MNSKATLTVLDALHGELAKHFGARLQAGDCTAAELAQIRQFLKDNNIEVDKTHGAKRFANIVQNLPFPGEDQESTDVAPGVH